MKFGARKPSIKKMLSARVSAKRYLRHSLKLEAPRGWGWLTNPKKAAYNRVYSRTTFSLADLLKKMFGQEAAKPSVGIKQQSNTTHNETSVPHIPNEDLTEAEWDEAFAAFCVNDLKETKDFDEFKDLYFFRKEEKIKKPCNDKILAFVKLHIDENEKFPNFGLNLSKNEVKALQVILERDDVSIDAETLEKFITKEFESQVMAKFKQSFFDLNPELQESENFKDWIDAYAKTFDNDYRHIATLAKLVEINEIEIEPDKEFSDMWDWRSICKTLGLVATSVEHLEIIHKETINADYDGDYQVLWDAVQISKQDPTDYSDENQKILAYVMELVSQKFEEREISNLANNLESKMEKYNIKQYKKEQ